MSFVFMRWVTNFGDTGVVLPLAVLLTCVLLYAESPRAAWLFARAMLVCVAVMTALKIVFIACGHHIGLGITSPSGHASLTTMFYGALAIIVWAQPRPVLRILAAGFTAMLIVLVAISRLWLHAHVPQEVALGLLVGSASLALFARPYLAMPHPVIRLRRAGAVLAVAFLVSYGTVLPAERVLRAYIPFFQIGVCSR
jgi:undecaprenyl-diphosphatase